VAESRVGVTDSVAYLWSARHLIVLPAGERQEDPLVIIADEGIRLGFAVAGGWLLLGEASIWYVTALAPLRYWGASGLVLVC
jgi:hypothetical protein